MTEQVTSLDARNQAELDQLSINTLRLLAVDQVEAAKSGHPGAPLGCSPIMYLLYHKFMKYNPTEPLWSDRDRFVLSNGHASAMLYGTLHLTGYDLPLEQLKQFRQWGSHTPGHPEYGETPGVEVTTGPLGQGFGMAVGIAAAEKHLSAVYNRDMYHVVDHHTFVLCGDGDLMEGISHETASLAGTLRKVSARSGLPLITSSTPPSQNRAPSASMASDWLFSTWMPSARSARVTCSGSVSQS